MTVVDFWIEVVKRCTNGGAERWGQAMFNVLRDVPGLEEIRATEADPWENVKNAIAAREWFAAHVVVEGNKIVEVRP